MLLTCSTKLCKLWSFLYNEMVNRENEFDLYKGVILCGGSNKKKI